jgi:hypothetical protein
MNEEFPKIEGLPGFCMAVGWIAQNWAMMEQNFDMWIAIIYHRLDGRTRVEPRLPIPFSKKVDFLEKAFSTLEPLKRFTAEVAPMLKQARELSQRRNDLVHGVLRSLGRDGAWVVGVFDYEKAEDRRHWHIDRTFTFSPKDFEALESELVPLVTSVCKFGVRFEREVP